MRDLRECYGAMTNEFSVLDEPWESVALVEKYRQYWRPENPRVILLAESHVYTSNEDRACKTNMANWNLSGYPENYANFVYCLAYGETSLIKGRAPAHNSGTPQFWKLFYSCQNYVKSNNDFTNNSDSILHQGTSDDNRRILNKIKLLRNLQKRGIWLVDASIMAIYQKPQQIKNKAVRLSWERHTRQIVKNANPAHVIVIGQGVADTLGNNIPCDYTVISQPNAFLTAGQLLGDFQKYFRLCKKYAP